MTLIIFSLIYLIGINISYWMLITEHKAEGNIITHGDRALCLLLSLLSYGTIIWCLIANWIEKINRTGYWDKPEQGIPSTASVNGKQNKAAVVK